MKSPSNCLWFRNGMARRVGFGYSHTPNGACRTSLSCVTWIVATMAIWLSGW